MGELVEEQQFKFNAFHILLFLISINVLLYGKVDHIIDIMDYITNLDMIPTMFIMAHVLLVYFVLSSVQFAIKFKAIVKFNLDWLV